MLYEVITDIRICPHDSAQHSYPDNCGFALPENASWKDLELSGANYRFENLLLSLFLLFLYVFLVIFDQAVDHISYNFV